MFWFQLRPTFMIPLSHSRSEVIESLRLACQEIGDSKNFAMFGEYGELHVPVAEHRLWSPHLSFYVSEREHGSLIHGRYAPRLEVWTFVWIVYLAMAFSAFFGITLAYSQWMLGQPAYWGLSVSIVALLTIFVLYMVAGIGQQWSSDQMSALRQNLEAILEKANLHTEHSLAPELSPRVGV